MHCEACGNENRPGSRFCDRCGAALSLSCPACGTPNRGDAQFCSECGGAMGRAGQADAPASPATERRQVSVLFADIVGFTSFAEGRDPERVRELQSRYFELASETVERHGGTVEKFIGDAVMAVWGTPTAHEDDAQRAARTGLQLLEAVEALGHGLQARAGVVTGEAAVTIGATNQGMVAGDMVNTAARLCSIAKAGELIVSETTMRQIAPYVDAVSLPAVKVKGKEKELRIYNVLGLAASGENTGSDWRDSEHTRPL